MAVDTSLKRSSCLGFALAALRTGVYPPTGGDLSSAERLHANFLYAGIAASAPGGTLGGLVFASNLFLSPVIRTVR